MKTFKQFITERRSSELGEEAALRLIEERCSQYLEGLRSGDHGLIYRGMGGGFKYGFVNPTQGKRKSSNTTNYYTEIIDYSWPEQYPDRSKSIICSTSKDHAETYGSLFIVFPFDDAKIAYVDAPDFWFGFPKIKNKAGLHNLKEFNTFMDEFTDSFYRLISVKGGEIMEEDKKKIQSIDSTEKDTLENILTFFDFFDRNIMGIVGLNTYIELLEGIQDKQIVIDVMNNFKESGFDTIKEFVFSLFNPRENNITLVDVDNYKMNISAKREVWTDSRSILVDHDQLKAVNDKFNLNIL